MNEAALRRSVDRVRAAVAASDLLDVTALAARARTLVSADGVAVSVGADPRRGHLLEVVAADGLGQPAEQLQACLGEGPSYTAHRTGRTVEVPDLEVPWGWVVFADAAGATGLGSAFAAPLRAGSTTVGALSFYRRRRGPLTDAERDDVTTLAPLATHALLAGSPGCDDRHEPTTGNEVHLAVGMVSAHLDVEVITALALLRARAFATDRDLHRVAQAVIAAGGQLDPSSA